MFRIEKRFTVPIGHRLSKHKGRCHSIHGHNFTILVGLKSEKINDDDMIEDFANIKEWIGKIVDEYDHTFLVNKVDEEWMKPIAEKMQFRLKIFDQEGHDPTAEMLSRQLYYRIKKRIEYESYELEYVTVYENENSKATYSNQ